MTRLFALAFAAAALAGCAYRWTSPVPADMRTVSVPTFRNESDVVELGAAATRQVLREFQREGTFRIAMPGDAALEIQGTVKSASAGQQFFKREVFSRGYEYRYTMEADVSLVDKRTGRVLVDNRRYEAQTTFFSDSDVVTARRDASGRLAEDLARQIVDDVAGRRWDGEKERKEKGK